MDWAAWERDLVIWGAKRRCLSITTPKRRRVSTRASPGRRGGRIRPRVQRRETTNSAVLEMLSDWLLSEHQASMLANSAGIEAVLEAGTIRVASSAYFINTFPGVTHLRSQEETIYIGGPTADPWTTLELMNSSDDVPPENLVLWDLSLKKLSSQE